MSDGSARQTEVDALLAAIAGMRGNEPAPPVSAPAPGEGGYDFRQPQRLTDDHLAGVQRIHEDFAQDFATALVPLLRTAIQARVVRAELTTVERFTAGLTNPTAFVHLNAAPRDGSAYLAASPRVIYPMLDRLLGSTAPHLHIPHRPMTRIEKTLTRRVFDLAAGSLTRAWSGVAPLAFQIQSVETDPALATAADPSESFVAITFEVSTAGVSGSMSLCLPCRWIEGVKHKLATRDRPAPASEPLRKEAIAHTLQGAPVEVRATLARTTITVAELLHMSAGDVLVTQQPADSPISLTVDGREKFQGRLGQSRGRLGVKISRPL